MDGKQFQRTLSEKHTKSIWLSIAEYFVLFGLGIIAILLHSRLRTPISVPGHHGLEFMAILMAGRVASKNSFASSISSLGIGFILLFPVFGFKDPFMGINYMFPGFVIDLLYNMTRQFKWQMLAMAIVAGLAYLTIPLSRIVIHLITAYPYSSFIKFGYAIPLLNYFVFGMAGGFAGAGISKSILKLFNKSK